MEQVPVDFQVIIRDLESEEPGFEGLLHHPFADYKTLASPHLTSLSGPC